MIMEDSYDMAEDKVKYLEYHINKMEKEREESHKFHANERKWVRNWDEIEDDIYYILASLYYKDGIWSLANPISLLSGWQVKQHMGGIYAALKIGRSKEI
jgi:hypothetical protein